jgi:Tetratricopeptide repeat
MINYFYIFRAAVYAALGEYEKALKDAERSISIQPRWLKVALELVITQGWLQKSIMNSLAS